MTALLLLAPGTPMLFQGQEFGASSPFVYFADHRPELAAQIASGRAEFLGQFASLALPESEAGLPNPGELATFERCKLDMSEREKHAEAYALHRDLLKLRREDPVFRAQTRVDGAVLGPEAFVLRFFGGGGDDRLLIVNFAVELPLAVMAEPLLAPPPGKRWQKIWSTEEPAYGGSGMPPLETRENWVLPGRAAAVLAPVEPPRKTIEWEQRLLSETTRKKRERQRALARERNA
jgi:maltooligosyltrehalose trehalohydrolase